MKQGFTIIGILALSALVLMIAAGCTIFPGATPRPSPAIMPSPTVVPTPSSTPVPRDPTAGLAQNVDGYVALVPRVLRAGQTEAVSLTLLSGDRQARGRVQVSLLKDGQSVAAASSSILGKGVIPLRVPRLRPGEYQLELKGPNFQDKASLRVEEGTLVFLETDKPIYKPGQKVFMRILTLDPELKPLQNDVTIEVQDSKGIKVFKKVMHTDDYGMATLELPLSTEPNLGVWKITAHSGKHTSQVDLRVEEYVLPKYEVKIDLPKGWFLAGESINGKVKAEYTFGKPVKGEVEIVAKRYVGTWERYATFTKAIDGETDFQLPAVGYVAGVPGARGMGNVTLEVTVREKATGYEEKTTTLLTVAPTAVSLQVIPESPVFKAALPFNFLIITETPDNRPLDRQVALTLRYLGKDFHQIKQEIQVVSTVRGKALLRIIPPADSVTLTLEASSEQAHASLALRASYSPSGNFIHVEQVSKGPLRVGGMAEFKVYSTTEAANFYYEVLSRGKVVFTDVSQSADISFNLTPLMAPSSRLLVYQILPNSEVAADYLPFTLEGDYPHQVKVGFSQGETRPGQELDINVQTQGQAKVGLAVVDRSVFILAEKRLNLQQVFQELEHLYLQPQVELHEVKDIYTRVKARGAIDTFRDAGVVVMSNKKVPEGEEYRRPRPPVVRELAEQRALPMAAPTPTPMPAPPTAVPSGLAEVQKVRQFFPETWLWTDVTTDNQGQAKVPVQAPDSITTWALRAIALSKDKGLGIAESQLRVFQPFFLQPDLPYSVIRGEEFPIKIALYNYLDAPQEIFVELEKADWFDLLDQTAKSVALAARDVGGVEFKIRPRVLGARPLRITARSKEAADAVIKDIIVEPEGVEREVVKNLVLSAGAQQLIDTSVPPLIVPDSARAYIALTGSYLTQTIEGLERLLRMPFGCGEQNMILVAPNTFIMRYLKATNQLKPEVMAKAEQLMITGYQRQLTFRRSDGSFSAFGQQDKEGSLWLTAFVLKTFAQARGLIFIDDSILEGAKSWILRQQRSDGSFEPVGFLHHQELLGGLQGKTALTAFVAIALREASGETASGKPALSPSATPGVNSVEGAVRYLEQQLGSINDPYTMAITTYALELAKSSKANDAYQKLIGMARESESGLHWGESPIIFKPGDSRQSPPPPTHRNRSAAIEATGYATLALIRHGDLFNASRAARWLVSQRNAYGGFDSTQDTVVGLQALTAYSTVAQANVNITLTLSTGSGQALQGSKWQKEVSITPDNFDVLQVLEVPIGQVLEVKAQGKGQVVVQVVQRFNIPRPEEKVQEIFQIKVNYSADKVEVNDRITVSVSVRFTPPVPVEAGMVVLDVAIPTGFTPVTQSIQALAKTQPKVKRFDVAGRKVIFYIEDMSPGEEISFNFQAQALYPVRTKAVTSQAYSYYRPEWKGETQGKELQVVSKAD